MQKSLWWESDKLFLLDQTKLPIEKTILEIQTVDSLIEAIKMLRVRGAPAIGVAAAYGICIAINEGKYSIEDAAEFLKKSRPTAVNLFWAIDRMLACYHKKNTYESVLSEANKIAQEDEKMCELISNYIQEFIPQNANIITHCNTGFLATAGIGTALGGIYKAHELGKNPNVFVDETRPLLQGSRLTAWELMQANINATLISDNMAAHLMKRKNIDLVIVGADRITANGDTANKIGTYSLAVNAKFHQIPFVVAAPSSTFDLTLKTGTEIPIEERHKDELTFISGKQIAPVGVSTFNPAFDVTENELITAIVTEKGVLRKNFKASIKKMQI
jgi:methylthioribose-1-phosphate isomerase